MNTTKWERRGLSLNQTPKDFLARATRETDALVGIASVGKCSTLSQSARSYRAAAEQAALSYSANRLMEAFCQLQFWMERRDLERFPTVAQSLKSCTDGSALLSEWNRWSITTAQVAYDWMLIARLTDEELGRLLPLAEMLVV